MFFISWAGAATASYYTLEYTDDEQSGVWLPLGTTSNTYFEASIPVLSFAVRVAGVNIAQGPWVVRTYDTQIVRIINMNGDLIVNTNDDQIINKIG